MTAHIHTFPAGPTIEALRIQRDAYTASEGEAAVIYDNLRNELVVAKQRLSDQEKVLTTGSVTSPPHEPPPPLGSVTAPPAAPEPASQSAVVTPPAAPGNATSPPHEPPPLLGSVTALPAAAEPASQSAVVTLPAPPGSVTSPPHEPPPASRGASRHRRPPRNRPRNPPDPKSQDLWYSTKSIVPTKKLAKRL